MVGSRNDIVIFIIMIINTWLWAYVGLNHNVFVPLHIHSWLFPIKMFLQSLCLRLCFLNFFTSAYWVICKTFCYNVCLHFLYCKYDHFLFEFKWRSIVVFSLLYFFLYLRSFHLFTHNRISHFVVPLFFWLATVCWFFYITKLKKIYNEN